MDVSQDSQRVFVRLESIKRCLAVMVPCCQHVATRLSASVPKICEARRVWHA